jgi:hypothetical protein
MPVALEYSVINLLSSVCSVVKIFPRFSRLLSANPKP